MATCPFCEHVQERGEECDLCGRRLSGPGTEPAPVAALAELEPTAHPPTHVATAPLPDLEATRVEAAAAPDAASIDLLEPTRFATGATLPPEPVPGLESHQAEPISDGGADPFAPVVCRYCRSVAPPGERICGRCGMRLPTFEAAAVVAAEEQRCGDCGAVGTGPLCRQCGARMPSASGA
jgi:hypothetical protein